MAENPPSGTACAPWQLLGHFCPAFQYFDGDPVCVFCLDGEPRRRSIELRRKLARPTPPDPHAKPPAPVPQAPEPEAEPEPEAPKKESPTMPETKKCAAPGCTHQQKAMALGAVLQQLLSAPEGVNG